MSEIRRCNTTSYAKPQWASPPSAGAQKVDRECRGEARELTDVCALSACSAIPGSELFASLGVTPGFTSITPGVSHLHLWRSKDLKGMHGRSL